MVEAQARFGKIVQVGTMNRSRPPVHRRDQVHAGRRSSARSTWRAGCASSRGRRSANIPMARCSPARSTRSPLVARRSTRPTTPPYLSKVDYDLWLGPGAQAAVQPQPLPLQLALALGVRQRRHRQPGPAPVRHRALGARQAGAPRQDQLDGRLLRQRGLTGNARRADGALRVRRRHDHGVRHARRAHQRRRRSAHRQPLLRLEGLAVDRRKRTPVAVVHGRGRREEREGAGISDAEGCRGRRTRRAHDDRVPALSELHRRDSRERPEEADVRHPGRASLVDAAAPREHLVSRRDARSRSMGRPSDSSTTRRRTRS